MRRHPNLIRRHNVFYFRCRVPISLIDKIGRRELARSLKTTDRSQAKIRAAALTLLTYRLWFNLQSAMTKEQIDDLVGRWLKEELAQDVGARANIDFARDFTRDGADPYEVAAHMFRSESESSYLDWQDIVQRGAWYEAAPATNALLKQHGIEPDSDLYKALKTTLKAEIDEEVWKTLYGDVSRPFDKSKSHRIAVKVINHLGDEVMKVFAMK